MDFSDLAIEGLAVLRDVESLSHEGIANSENFLPQLGTVLEDYDIDCLILKLVILGSCLSRSLRINNILEEGKGFAASGTEQKLLQTIFL